MAVGDSNARQLPRKDGEFLMSARFQSLLPLHSVIHQLPGSHYLYLFRNCPQVTFVWCSLLCSAGSVTGDWLSSAQPIWDAETPGPACDGKSSDYSWLAWLSRGSCRCSHYIQLDLPPIWLLQFLFFILFIDYYQMLSACPAFLSLMS